MSVKHWLVESMASRGKQPAIVWKGQEVAYRDLIAGVDRWSRALTKHNVKPGDSVAICGDYCPAVCALLVSLLANRNVVVPLTLPAGARRDDFLWIAQTSTSFHFDGDRLADVAHYSVDTDHQLLRDLRSSSSPGLVLFSSGSAGVSKAALLDFDKVLSKFRKQRPVYRTLVFLLPDHIGGINTLFHVLSQGGTVVPVEGRDPMAVCRLIERNQIELLPTSPTFLNLLLMSEAYLHHDCSSLRLISYGTEPMPPATLKHLGAVFPGVQLKQTYGLSELGIIPTKSRDSGSPWVKVGGAGYETKVVDGVLWIRSESAMLGYLNWPSPLDADGWFNTGDSVEVDGEWLRILGRRSEIINVGGEKVYPAEVEGVLHEVENIVDATVTGRANPVAGQVVCARVVLREPEPVDRVFRRIRSHCRNRLEPFKVPAAIELWDKPLYGDRFKKLRNER